MPKGVIKIPKVNEDCKNGKCGHEHEVPFEINEPPKAVPTASFVMDNNQQQQQLLQTPPPQIEKPKKLTHEEMAEMIPNGINVMKCPGGDCGHQKIKNPKKTKKYKACPHCSANTLPKGSDTCPYCTKSIDEDEELDDGIELEDNDDE